MRAYLLAKLTLMGGGGGSFKSGRLLVAGFFETSNNQFWKCTETATTLKCQMDVLSVQGFHFG